jgi:hypothetical protein
VKAENTSGMWICLYYTSSEQLEEAVIERRLDGLMFVIRSTGEGSRSSCGHCIGKELWSASDVIPKSDRRCYKLRSLSAIYLKPEHDLLEGPPNTQV